MISLLLLYTVVLFLQGDGDDQLTDHFSYLCFGQVNLVTTLDKFTEGMLSYDGAQNGFLSAALLMNHRTTGASLISSRLVGLYNQSI